MHLSAGGSNQPINNRARAGSCPWRGWKLRENLSQLLCHPNVGLGSKFSVIVNQTSMFMASKTHC
eukprot:scaffold2793_cov106-Skeletonema_menzelii.AAC.3